MSVLLIFISVVRLYYVTNELPQFIILHTKYLLTINTHQEINISSEFMFVM